MENINTTYCTRIQTHIYVTNVAAGWFCSDTESRSSLLAGSVLTPSHVRRCWLVLFWHRVTFVAGNVTKESGKETKQYSNFTPPGRAPVHSSLLWRPPLELFRHEQRGTEQRRRWAVEASSHEDSSLKTKWSGRPSWGDQTMNRRHVRRRKKRGPWTTEQRTVTFSSDILRTSL